MFRRLAPLALLLALPSFAGAQATSVSSYLAANREASSDALLAGGSITREAGHLGVRWGFGMGLGSAEAGSQSASVLMNTEADALLFVLDPDGNAPTVPFLTAGLGLSAVREFGVTEVRPMWSYGGGLRTPVTGRLSLQGEARHRQALPIGERDPLSAELRGMEYRVGLSLRIGRSARALPRPGLPSPLPNVRPITRAELATPAARERVTGATVTAAHDYLGTPYVWGGNTPQSGFDCSGFVRYVYALQGIALPRVSRDQAKHGRPLPLDVGAFRPGDLLAFASDGQTVDHVALYAGDGRIIHSSASGGGVRVDDLKSRRGSWYLKHMVAARRVVN